MSAFEHALLGETKHAFADVADREGVVRPRQVHGTRVVEAGTGTASLGEADAVYTRVPGMVVGVVTADCAPILVRAAGGAGLAIHAGWRGFAAGVVEAAIGTLRAAVPGEHLVAVVGPCAAECCYEVDGPVLDALSERYADMVSKATVPSRPGHARLDLGGLVARALQAAGVTQVATTRTGPGCTICDTGFESYRRDGDRSGRMLHWIAGR